MSLTTSPASETELNTKPLTVRELTGPQDHAVWNAFVGRSPEGDVLQSWEWGGVKSADWTPMRLGLFREDRMTGGVSLLRHTPAEANERMRRKYGLPDLSHLTDDELTDDELADRAEATLVALPPEKVAEARRLGLA